MNVFLRKSSRTVIILIISLFYVHARACLMSEGAIELERPMQVSIAEERRKVLDLEYIANQYVNYMNEWGKEKLDLELFDTMGKLFTRDCMKKTLVCGKFEPVAYSLMELCVAMAAMKKKYTSFTIEILEPPCINTGRNLICFKLSIKLPEFVRTAFTFLYCTQEKNIKMVEEIMIEETKLVCPGVV